MPAITLRSVKGAALSHSEVDANFSNLNNGTAFPGSPASGDRYFRTDRQLGYTYDGTRWLSDQWYAMVIPPRASLPPYSGTVGGAFGAVNPFAGLYDIYITQFVCGVYLTGAVTYTIDLNTLPGTAISSVATGAVSATTDTMLSATVNSVLASTNVDFQVNVTYNSGTGTIYPHPAVRFRLIG